MNGRRMPGSGDRLPKNALEQDVRDQEGLRAFRELAAYFKGHRTEREARAALKILKAFIRERERVKPAKRRPLSRRIASAPARTVDE